VTGTRLRLREMRPTDGSAGQLRLTPKADGDARMTRFGRGSCSSAVTIALREWPRASRDRPALIALPALGESIVVAGSTGVAVAVVDAGVPWRGEAALRGIALGTLSDPRLLSPDEREARLCALHAERWTARRLATTPGPFGDAAQLVGLRPW